MKRKSPISVERIQFYTYERYDEELCIIIGKRRYNEFPYDDRRDFEVNDSFDGIAVKLVFCNDQDYYKGVRRRVELSLVDLTSRCEIAVQTVKVNMRKDVFVRDIYVNFPVETNPLKRDHTYKLRVKDATSSAILEEAIFHLFDSVTLGASFNWYEVLDAGIKPAWERNTYKVLQTVDDHDYYVRFNVSPKFKMKPAVLPELELRLHYPDGKTVTSHFKEPQCYGIDNFENNIWTVDYLFITSQDINGTFYAELLCMDWPIGGFVFDTERENIRGVWFGNEIEPLDDYSPDAVVARLENLLPFTSESSPLMIDKDFEDLLQEFISSQMHDNDSEER